VDGRRSELFLRKGERAYWVDRINGTISMSRKAPRLALRESQTTCLVALRHRKCSTPRLAIEAKLDIKKDSSRASHPDTARTGRTGGDPDMADDSARRDLPL
jgi:hypothetical protein